MERFICFIMLLSINMVANANDDIESKMWQATLFGGLYLNNEQAWQLEPSVSWHFHKNIGIRLGLEFTNASSG